MNFDQLKNYLDEQSIADAFSGVVLVAENGEEAFTYVSGFAHQGFEIRNQIDTKFNIGSLGKMFTAVAVGQLVEKGLLEFQDLVGKHLPDYPNKDVVGKVRLHHLLTHTSGMGTMFNRKFAENRWKLRTTEKIMEMFANDPLHFEPGRQWQYSNAAFVVLGRIVEVISGENYIDYVRNHIFDSAKMKNTDYLEIDHDTANSATGYTFRLPFSAETDFSKPRRNNLLELPVIGFAGGGEYSTAHDMLSFSNALKGYELLSPEMTENILSFKVETEKPNLNYGYAFYILNMDGHTIIGREGGYAGVSTMFHMYQDRPYTLIVLSNYDDPAAKNVAMKFSSLC